MAEVKTSFGVNVDCTSDGYGARNDARAELLYLDSTDPDQKVG